MTTARSMRSSRTGDAEASEVNGAKLIRNYYPFVQCDSRVVAAIWLAEPVDEVQQPVDYNWKRKRFCAMGKRRSKGFRLYSAQYF